MTEERNARVARLYINHSAVQTLRQLHEKKQNGGELSTQEEERLTQLQAQFSSSMQTQPAMSDTP